MSEEALAEARARAAAAEKKLVLVATKAREFVVRSKALEAENGTLKAKVEEQQQEIAAFKEAASLMQEKEKKMANVVNITARMMAQQKSLKAQLQIAGIKLQRVMHVARKVQKVRYLIGQTNGDMNQSLIMTSFIQAVMEELEDERAAQDAKRERDKMEAMAAEKQMASQLETRKHTTEEDLTRLRSRIREVEAENRSLIAQMAAVETELREAKEGAKGRSKGAKVVRKKGRRKKKKKPVRVLARAVALFAFEATETVQLAMEADDEVEVLERKQDWCKVRSKEDGRVGYVPTNYLQELPPDPSEEAPTQSTPPQPRVKKQGAKKKGTRTRKGRLKASAETPIEAEPSADSPPVSSSGELAMSSSGETPSSPKVLPAVPSKKKTPKVPPKPPSAVVSKDKEEAPVKEMTKLRKVEDAIGSWMGDEAAAGGISSPVMVRSTTLVKRERSLGSQSMDVLQVTVLEGRNLRVPGHKSALEFRAEVEVDLTRHSTVPVKNKFTVPCAWNESFKFALAEAVEDTEVLIRIFVDVGKKKDVVEHELGVATCPLDEMEASTDLTKWYPVLDAGQDVRGILQVNFSVTQHESKVQVAVSNKSLQEVSLTRKIDYEKSPDNLEFVDIDDESLDALQRAASKPKPDLDHIVQQIWEGHPLDVKWTNPKGETFFHLVAAQGDAKLLQILLSNGSDISAASNRGDTAAHMAARAGKAECLAFVLEKAPVFGAAALKYRRNGRSHSVLDLAAIGGHEECMAVALKAGLEVDEQDSNGSTALIKAAAAGSAASLEYLIHRGAFVNAEDSEGSSAFLLACCKNHQDCIQLLRKAGADTSVVNAAGDSALWAAITTGDRDLLMSLLQDSRARPDQKCGKYKYTLLMRCLLQLEQRECEQAVGLLIMKGADVNACNELGQTPLHLACAMGRFRSVQFMVEACSADVNVVDAAGNTPLHFAFQADIVEVLVKAGARLNVANSQGNTCLHSCFAFGSPEAVKVMQSHGAMNTARNGHGNIPSECVFSSDKEITFAFYEEDSTYAEGGGLKIGKA